MSKPSFSRKRKGKKVDPYPLGAKGPSKSSSTKRSGKGRPRKAIDGEDEDTLVQGKYYLLTYEQQEPVLVWVRGIEEGEIELDVLSHSELAYGSVGPGDMMYISTDDPELEEVEEISDPDAEFAKLTAKQACAYLSMELEGRVEEAEDGDEMDVADSLGRMLERVERKEMDAEDYTEAIAQLHLMLEDETYPDGEEESVERALKYFEEPARKLEAAGRTLVDTHEEYSKSYREYIHDLKRVAGLQKMTDEEVLAVLERYIDEEERISIDEVDDHRFLVEW